MREALRRYVRWKKNSRTLDRLCREHPLKYLFLEITRRCNLSCAYCGSDCSPGATPEELPTEEWIKIVRQLAEDFNPREVMIAVTGGEPLLRPGALELFAELNHLGFPFGMVTNGTLIRKELARKIVETGIGSISLSLDAPPAVNDRYRGAGGAEKVQRAIESLRAVGYAGKLEIISTLTREAVAHLDDMRRHVATLRVPLWRIAPVMPIGRAATDPQLVPGAQELKAMLAFIHAARGDRYSPAPEFGEEGYLGDAYEGAVRPYLCQCRAGITTGGILADGRIGACPELSDAFVQGDIRTERFREVWERRYQIFRDRSWTRRGECAGCEAYDRCRGGSLHLYPEPKAEFLRCFYLMLGE